MRDYTYPSRKCLKVNDGDKADLYEPMNPKAIRALDNWLARSIDKEKMVDFGVGDFNSSWFKVSKTPRAWLEDAVSKNL